MEKTAGIIAEYNPLHRGHQFHIQQTRRVTGAKSVIVVMSGDYVQRGEPAIFDKYIRTQMALQAGADLVIELPVEYACASAEFFALGSVKILDCLGIVTDLCFGSEAGNLAFFLEVSKILTEEPQDYRTLLTDCLRRGMSFPLARQEALLSYLYSNASGLSAKTLADLKEFLAKPNNILGIEYSKALYQLSSSIIPHTIPRSGAGYHEEQLCDPSQSYSSASAIRQAIFSQKEDLSVLSAHVPRPCLEVFTSSVCQDLAVKADDFSLLLHMRLLQENAGSLSSYLDVSRDLANRIQNLKRQYQSFSQFTQLLKTRELTYTRIQRALLHILLGIKKAPPISYVRILGVRKESRHLLSQIQKSCSLPVAVTPAKALKDLPAHCQEDLRFQTYVCDLYESVRCNKNQSPFCPESSRPLLVL